MNSCSMVHARCHNILHIIISAVLVMVCARSLHHWHSASLSTHYHPTVSAADYINSVCDTEGTLSQQCKRPCIDIAITFCTHLPHLIANIIASTRQQDSLLKPSIAACTCSSLSQFSYHLFYYPQSISLLSQVADTIHTSVYC